MLLDLPRHRPALRHLAVLTMLCCSGLAHAQFVWIAPNGARQYSDQPPPPGTPAARIIKMPGRAATSLPSDTPAPGAAAVQQAPDKEVKAVKVAPSLAEREADYRKRADERAAAEQKAQQDERAQANRQADCDAARQALRAVNSGIRIADLGPDGQKRYLSDAERTLRGARAAANVSACNTP